MTFALRNTVQPVVIARTNQVPDRVPEQASQPKPLLTSTSMVPFGFSDKNQARLKGPRFFRTVMDSPLMMVSAANFGLGMPFLATLPEGKGQPVMLIPGWQSKQRQMNAILKPVLEWKGYTVVDAGLNGKANNVLNKNSHLKAMRKNLQEQFEANGRQKIALVGWSLGGVQASELAKMEPEMVSQVISMGSPLRVVEKNGGVPLVLEKVGEYCTPFVNDALLEQRKDQLHQPPPVPATAIFSKNDGIVRPSIAQRKADEAKQRENVRVYASHVGMGYDWPVAYIILDRLAQSKESWKPFSRESVPALAKLAFPR